MPTREPRVRRTELTCPAHSLAMMTKAAASAADEVIFDLEDACAPSLKEGARKTVVEALNTLDFHGKTRAFRVNGLRTRWFYRDLIEVVEAAGRHVDAVVVPKVDGPEDVALVDVLLSQIEENVGLPRGRIELEVLIESARGLLNAAAIATASPRVASLIFGIADYAGDTGAAQFANDQFQTFHYPKSHLLAAARAAGVAAIDNVTVQFRDLAQVKRDAEDGARLGYDGKWAVHPAQLEIINAAYTPGPEEIERARTIVAAHRASSGAVAVGDEMVDAATLRVEEKKLAVARRAGVLREEDAAIRATRLDHTALCVGDMDAAIRLFEELLGSKCAHRESVATQKVEAAFFDFPNGASLELVTSDKRLGGNAGLEKFVEKRGDALHHLALRVTGLDALLERLAAKGVPLIDKVSRPGARGHRVAFLHPKALNGTLLELVEAHE